MIFNYAFPSPTAKGAEGEGKAASLWTVRCDVYGSARFNLFRSKKSITCDVYGTGLWSSRPRELHPQSLTDPYMNVSIHTARVIQSVSPNHIANAQTALAYVSSHFLNTVLQSGYWFCLSLN